MTRWRYITGSDETASGGLAADEFLVRTCTRPTLRLYSYRSHCALVGRFQNLEAELRLAECKRLGVAVNRRPTGGGAIIMGERQLALALAIPTGHPAHSEHPTKVFPDLARGIVSGLDELGITAEYRPKNDIEVRGRKIAGTAVCVDESGALLYHASILLDLDVQLMLRVLNTPVEKISDKAIASFEERLTTASAELGRPVDLPAARKAVRRGFERAFGAAFSDVPLTAAELRRIGGLETQKYLSREWVHQRQPTGDMVGTSIRKTSAGLVRTYAALVGDTIKSILITGDFFSADETINGVEAALKWGPATREAIERAVEAAFADNGHGPDLIGSAELADIVYEAVADARSKPVRNTSGAGVG